MKIKEIGNPNITVQEYLRLNGIKDVDVYLNPTDECFEDVRNYNNVSDGAEMLIEVLNGF